MKRVLLLGIALVFVASLASAQAGFLGVFADPGGISCDLTDTGPGLANYFVVHMLAPCVTASQFSAPMPACFVAGVFLSDTAIFPVTIGNSQTGVAVGYGANLASPVHCLTINIFAQGLTPAGACCPWPLLPDPALPSGKIEVVDCGGALLFATGQIGALNSNPPACDCSTLPVEESTWGQVKSLYSE